MPPGPVSLRSLLVAVIVLFSVSVVVWVATRVYRQQRGGSDDTYADLRVPYIWMCVAVAVTVVGLGVDRVVSGRGPSFAIVLVLLVCLPWTVFGINFAGRGHLLTRRRVYLGTLVYAVTFVPVVLDRLVDEVEITGFQFVSIPLSVLVLVFLAVVFSVSGMVLVSAYRHRSFPTRHGVVVLLPVVTTVLAIQMTRPSLPVFNEVVFVVMSLTLAGTLALFPTRYDLLRRRAGTGTIGERAAIREMDEGIVTVEPDGTLARANEAAAGLFGSKLDETPFTDLIGQEVATLTNRDTIECWTEDGRRQFDPRVRELTNEYDEVVGYTVILIDITDREIRRQRIEVLNRILRHNIRNSLDVIKADAELVDDEERAASILDTTDTLDRLSADARRIENLLRRSQGERSPAELTDIADSVSAAVASDHPEAAVTVDPPDESFQADAELLRFALRNIVENAVVHNRGDHPRVKVRGTRTEAGMRITVADDGPGIPEPERAVIENRTETPQSHGSSLGLWGTNWAVQQLGGELSFHESDLGGTAVVIELPVR
jgi:signal transduction histidine kinase